MKRLLLLAIVAIGFASCDNYPTIVMKNNIQKACEYAYFEGQRDALESDVRIKKLSDSTYIWTKSPWNDNETPIYNPRIDLKSNFK